MANALPLRSVVRPHPESRSARPAAGEVEALVSEFEVSLLRYATRLVRNSEQAQDIVQDTFVRFLTRTPSYGETRQKASWLYRVTHNLCIDWLKRESRRPEVYEFSAVLPREEKSDAAAVAADTRTRLDMLLEPLDDRQRHVLFLFFEEGRSYREIGEIADLSVSNVGMILHRALKKIRAAHAERPDDI